MFSRQPIIKNDYFTIITIIGPTINRSDASLKSRWIGPTIMKIGVMLMVIVMLMPMLGCVSAVNLISHDAESAD